MADKREWYRLYGFKISCGMIVFFIAAVIALYAYMGENSVIAIHDNLDLFVPQYRMLSLTGTWFSDHATIPFLGGIDRDYLPSQWNLVSFFYIILPPLAAYVACYIAKVVIAVIGGFLLGREALPDADKVTLIFSAFGYGLLNLFPNFGICFASIPLAVWLVIRTAKQPSLKLYAALFAYPLLSYFSYFGIFLCGYVLAAAVITALRRKGAAVPLRLLKADVCLAAGYIVFEYRLFRLMLFGNTVSIRETMAQNSFTFGEALGEAVSVLIYEMMHIDSGIWHYVLPVVAIGFSYYNIRYIVSRKAGMIFKDPLNLCVVLLVFNALVYGLYEVEAVRGAFETLVPPLKGFQFNRTVFFNPFLYYAALCIIASRLKPLFGIIVALIACAAPLMYGSSYNDLFSTALQVRYALSYGAPNENIMSYGDFYSVDVFEALKDEAGYTEGEYAACYAIYPAVLEYNGIATLDGYLGYYPQQYKEDFRKIIAPALDRVEANRVYYDDWGARCYLFSGVNGSIPYAVKQSTQTTEGYFELGEGQLFIDIEAFKALGGRYIFSRIPFDNAGAIGLELLAERTGDGLAYPVYVYGTR